MNQVIFFTENYGTAFRYRVTNISEALLSFGISSQYYHLDEFCDVIENLDVNTSVKSIVFHRCPYPNDNRSDKSIKKIRSLNIKLVFDVDDYIFEPSIIEDIWGYHQLSSSDKELYIEGVYRYRKLLKECDLFVAPTQFLCDRAEEIGINSSLVPNTFNIAQLKRSLLAKNKKKSKFDSVEIFYMSGSNTHGADFKQCEKALLKIMEKYTQVNFVLFGFLELGDEWIPFEDRTKKFGILNPEDLQEAINNYDINIAPLEVGDPFCEGKSPLKYFESALCKIPTIASSTSSFSAVIDHGENGLLASNTKEWFDCFEELVCSEVKRSQIGQKAFNKVTTTLGLYNLEKFSLIQSYGLDSKTNQVWIIPPIILGGGGHRNIFRNIYHLEKLGHKVDIFITDSEYKNSENLKKTIQDNFYKISSKVYNFFDTIKNKKYDLVFTTHWSTVKYIDQFNFIRNENVIYFVQDLEYMFYEMSSNYLMAENTYKKGFYAITSGSLPSKVLSEKYGMRCDYFQFPIDNDIYFVDELKMRKKNTVIFFSKPEMPRRCFELGIEALKILREKRKDIEVILFGSNNISKELTKDFNFKIKGLLPTINDLANLYREATLGMVFSTTNPSLVPYEMMACGLPIVDLKTEISIHSYGDKEDVAVLSEPDPSTMANTIIEMMDNSHIREEYSKNGLDFVKTFPDENIMAKTVEGYVLSKYIKNFSLN